ncbi:MAG: S41 family peptidase [Salinivirgaceae bacterium]|jgi:carboxyl-terminal processing protease|nr:S41 family peptidase [Salinivirgaceae bacterium]
MTKRIVLSLIFGVLLFSFTSKAQLFNDEVYKFSKVLGYIDNFYVDSVDKENLVETAVVEMLKKLDPHSVYISKEDVKKMNEPLEGSFEGIGVQFNIMHDTLFVVSPISGGPSEKVGILAGDRIVAIDTENVAGIGLTNQMVFDRLKGKKGTIVVVSIKRREVNVLLDFEIIRDKIPIFSLDAAYMVDEKEKVGYIKLNRFSAKTMQEYREAMKKLRADGAENLILDLTDNGGGYLNMAHELADEFLKGGQMIVYTEGIKSPRQDMKATNLGSFNEGRVVIMVNEGSASASEIVSGAIQDWDRGVLVGRRSFGKGLVQRPLNLPDGSAMRLTIARYYTPTGRLIQKSYKGGNEAYRHDLVNRYNNGELSNEDSIHFPDSLKYATLVNARAVYGGGGIMPDIFVPIDTTDYSDYYRDLIRKGIINRFILTYMDEHRNELEKKYLGKKKDKDFSFFKSNYEVDDEFLKALLDFAEKEKLEFNEEEYNKSLTHLKINLKALVARDLFTTSEFYEIINQSDQIYLEALRVILDKDAYNAKLLK